MTIGDQIYNHAVKNYNYGGWDFVVECHTANEINKMCEEEGLTTFDEAKAYFADLYGLIDEMRQEIKSL